MACLEAQVSQYKEQKEGALARKAALQARVEVAAEKVKAHGHAQQVRLARTAPPAHPPGKPLRCEDATFAGGSAISTARVESEARAPHPTRAAGVRTHRAPC
jgi:hypothetical protein